MALLDYELADGIVLQKDIYKDKTLLLKKGIVLNAYLMRKLNNFGISLADIKSKENFISQDEPETSSVAKFLIIQKDDISAHVTKSVLIYAGFHSSEIQRVSDSNNLENNLSDLSYIFVDSKDYTKDFLTKLLLSGNKNKVTIFVLNCENCTPQHFTYNTDNFNVKFLYRPLTKTYIKALLNLY